MKLIYLACPYSVDNASHRQMKQRAIKATAKTAALMAEGFNVFSPLTHSDQIADYLPNRLRVDHEFWLSRDLQIIEKCDELHVLCIDGWDRSDGVKREMAFAKKLGKPIVLHP